MTAVSPTLGGDEREFLRKVLDASLNGVYVHDLDESTNVFINARYTALTGYSLADLGAMAPGEFFALFHPEDQAAVSRHLEALRDLADGASLEIEYRFRRADGGWMWCLSRDAVFERGTDGRVRRIIGTFLDISGRKRAEAKLQEKEARARRHLAEIEAIYANAPVGLCVLDAGLRFVRVNQCLAEINGVPAADHLGRTVREVVPRLADEVEPLLRRVIAGGESFIDREVRGETPAFAGEERTWLVSWLPLWEEGHVSGINGVVRDVTEERDALAALAESRERYRLVADFTYDWEDWVGPDGELRWMSPSCERISGHPAAAFHADPGLLERITHPQDRQALAAHLERSLQERDSQQLQFRIRRADGEERWLEHVCQPVYGTDGRFAGRRASIRDITEARHVQRALAESESRFRAIFDNAAVGIAQVGLDGYYLRVNRRLCEITGYNCDELARLRFQDITPPHDLPDDLGQARRLERGDIDQYTMDKRYLRKDGRVVWVKLTGSAVRRPDGSTDYFVAVIDDITEQREAAARARTLATVVETSADFIGVAHLDGRAIYLNRAGRELVGLADEAAVRATRVEDYLFPEDLDFVRRTVIPTVLKAGRWEGEFRFRHFVTGEPVDVHWDVVVISDPVTGEALRLATVTRDIRRQKATEASLRAAARRKDEFLAMLGHELRNPLAPIRSAVEVLQMLLPERGIQINWAMEVLDRQTAHLSRLLDDLLDVSRIVRGKLSLEQKPVELADVVQQAADGVRPLMGERGHRFEVEPLGRDVRVYGDPVRLSQILLNLLLNAANYTPPGGVVRIGVAANAAEVVVRVEDNGPGIPQSRVKELFEPFSRLQQTNGDSGGLGLGLTICKRLAEMHGGRLEVGASADGGAELALVLPRLAPGARQAAAESAPAAVSRSGLEVLVVDDNPDVAEALTLLLEVMGYTVDTAASAAEALELAAARRPRVALLDIGLPDMDGLELARRLRREFPTPDDMLLVAVTGYGHDEARERSAAAGFDEHLAKPVTRKTLQQLLDGLAAPR